MFCSLDLDSAFLIYRSCLNVNCMLIGSHQRVADKAVSQLVVMCRLKLILFGIWVF